MRNALLQPYAGQWVLKQSGVNLMVMQTHVSHRKVTGVLITPKDFHEEADGRFNEIKPPVTEKHVRSRRLSNGSLELLVGDKTDYDIIPMTLSGSNHAKLHWAKGYVPPWQFERVPGQSGLQPQLPIKVSEPQTENPPR